jgi:hypothetical protein
MRDVKWLRMDTPEDLKCVETIMRMRADGLPEREAAS